MTSARSKAMREIVFREMARRADTDPRFRSVLDPLGFFTVMELVDAIVEAVIAAGDEFGTDSGPSS